VRRPRRGALAASLTPAPPSFSLTTFSPSGKVRAPRGAVCCLLLIRPSTACPGQQRSAPAALCIAHGPAQIEHALAAVSSGATSLGIKGTCALAALCTPPLITCPAASGAIVIASEKRAPSLLVDDSALEKIAVVCPNIGIVYSGMGPDFRVLVAKARKSAQAYWKIYGEYPPTRVLVQEIASVMQEATQSG
jgi:20S proteasome alpha/beta subunit